MQTFVARQPIFGPDMKVFAYELIFRSGVEQVIQETGSDRATSSVISECFFCTGTSSMTGGNRVFINFTRNVLLGDYVQLLPKPMVVVEVTEDMAADEEVMKALGSLKDMGYMLALDDYKGADLEPLYPLVNIVKVDFSTTNLEEQRAFAQKFLPMNIKLLAEKVATHTEFKAAKGMGYSLFQGHFFCKPTMIGSHRIPETKLSRLRLLRVVSEPIIDIQKAEQIFKEDVALSYKLLLYINSAYFGLRHEVSNIRQALVLLGQKRLRKWASLIVAASLGDGKPSELLVTSITRARFCECMADLTQLDARKDDLFLLGMFSTLDAILDTSMDEVLEKMPLAPDLSSALLGEPGQLRDVLDVVIAYESADWDRFGELKEKLGFDESTVPSLHAEAVKMAEEILKLENAEGPPVQVG